MLGLRTRSFVTKDLEETMNEIERLTLRASDLRKELVLAGNSTEIQAILEAQPLGAVLRDGTPATPNEVLKERLDTNFVSLQHATDITDTYRNLRASLKVQDRYVRLASYGDDSMSTTQVMRKLYASETLRALLRYKNEDIGRFITIDSTGYVTIIR
jgi:hypothetical protein